MTTTYQMSEIEEYFGELFDDREQQASDMLDKYDWQTIEHYMDRDAAEDVHLAIAPCGNEHFLLAYMMAHAEKFGEDFEIN